MLDVQVGHSVRRAAARAREERWCFVKKMEVGAGKSETDISDGGVRGVVTVTKGDGGYVFVTAVDIERGVVVQVTLTKHQARSVADYLVEAAP